MNACPRPLTERLPDLIGNSLSETLNDMSSAAAPAGVSGFQFNSGWFPCDEVASTHRAALNRLSRGSFEVRHVVEISKSASERQSVKYLEHDSSQAPQPAIH